MNCLKKVHVSVLLFAVLVFTGCSGQAPKEVQSRVWKTLTIAKTNSSTSSRYSASVQGCRDVEIRPQVSGAMVSLHIKEGDPVRNGQLLFVIDQVPFKAALDEAQANVKAAEASLATARLNAESKQRLFDEQVISEFELLSARNALHNAEAALAQARAGELKARNDLSYTEVRSPVNGIAGVLPYRQGALVGPSVAQPLTTVSDNSSMFVYFSISENQALSLLRQWGSMEQTLANMEEVELILNDGSLYPKKGKVESISGVIDRNTGSVSVRAVFDNAERLLLSGSSGNVQINGIWEDVIVIPQSATVKVQDKYLVYKVTDGIARSEKVEVLPDNNGTEYIVLSGLNTGDVIVADGTGLIREGMEIN